MASKKLSRRERNERFRAKPLRNQQEIFQQLSRYAHDNVEKSVGRALLEAAGLEEA